MHLITMAHAGEAQGVIEKYQLERINQDLFKNESLVLLITGEGPFEAATKTALTISKFEFTQITNMGIAGTLDPSLKVGTFHPVRSIYLVQDYAPQFKTFKSFEEGLDCITSFERILDVEKAQKLKGIGTLVDREAWGIAMAARTANLPFQSYKLISDIAGSIESCELIKESAQLFSNLIAEFIGTILQIQIPQEELTSIPGFYFTFSTHHKFKTLIKKLEIKEDKDPLEILNSLPKFEEIKLPKDRTRKLLETMEERLDPLKGQITRKKSEWAKTFEDHGFRIQTDPEFENTEVTISLKVKTDEELKEKLSILNSLSLKPFNQLMNGEFDVE